MPISNFLWNEQAVISFFSHSELLAHEVLRPISHVRENWELFPGKTEPYEVEQDSFSSELNTLIKEISVTTPPKNYHKFENNVASYMTAIRDGEYELKNGIWWDHNSGKKLNIETLEFVLEQGSSGWVAAPELVSAAAGRVKAALHYGQQHYDAMEPGHRKMLAILLTIILFRHSDHPLL